MKNPFFRNVEYIKSNGKAFLEGMYFNHVVYEGTDPCLLFGGYVWFQATHASDPQLIYTIRLRKQGDGLKFDYERIMNPEVKGLVQAKVQ